MKHRMRSLWRALVAIAALAPAPAALAQQALLQGGPWTGNHAPMYFGPSGNFGQPILGDSGPAGGGAPGIGLSELGLTVQGTGTPPYANAGTGPFGANLCDYDAPITNATGYHYLCFSPNAQGGGLIAYGAGGSATPLPMQMELNGVLYQFPFTLSGIVGPNSTTVGDVAMWNNATGTLLKDAPVTGSGSVVLANSPTLTGALIVGNGTPLTFSVNPPVVSGASQFIPAAVTTTALPSLVIERSTTYSAGATTSPTLYVGTLAAVSNSAAFIDGIDSELEITANTGAGGGTIEAARGRCILDAGVANIGCWGGSFVAVVNATGTSAKGTESESSQLFANAPTPPSIVIANLSASYFASSGLSGDSGKIIDAAFLVNPFSVDGFQAGFECPKENSAGTVVRYACFEGAETATFGIDLSLGHWANAAINATGFFVTNAGVTSTTQLLLSSAASNFISATNTNGGAGSSVVIQGNNGTTNVTGLIVSGNGAVSVAGALTYGGVTLANSVTGTGSMVLSASPTLTGSVTLAGITGSTQCLQASSTGVVSGTGAGCGGGGGGTVTSVGFTGGLISVATATTTPALTVAGTSGGIPYFASSSTWASSAALVASALVVGGGAGAAPSTVTTNATVLTALGAAPTGSGGIVLAASPTLTGTIIGAAATWSGVQSFTNATGVTITPSPSFSGPFQFQGKNNGGGNPVALLIPPTGTNSQMTLDISPRGTATEFGFGATWMDISNREVSIGLPLNSLHLDSSFTNSRINIDSTEYNSGSLVPLFIGMFNGDTATHYDAIEITASTTPNVILLGGIIATVAAPTVAASQIGYGSTVTANTNCGTLASSAGCIVVNVAGTIHYVPYY